MTIQVRRKTKDGWSKWKIFPVCKTVVGNKLRFNKWLAKQQADGYYLKVKYLCKVFNEGEYQTKKELISAYLAFTNADEVRFVMSYWK